MVKYEIMFEYDFDFGFAGGFDSNTFSNRDGVCSWRRTL